MDEDFKKKSVHDFSPLKMKFRAFDAINPSEPATTRACIISKHITATQLVAYPCGLYEDLLTKAIPILVDVENNHVNRLKKGSLEE